MHTDAASAGVDATERQCLVLHTMSGHAQLDTTDIYEQPLLEQPTPRNGLEGGRTEKQLW